MAQPGGHHMHRDAGLEQQGGVAAEGDYMRRLGVRVVDVVDVVESLLQVGSG